MTQIKMRGAGLRKLLIVTKIEGRPNQWQAEMAGYLPEVITAISPGDAINAAISASMQFSKDAHTVKLVRAPKANVYGDKTVATTLAPPGDLNRGRPAAKSEKETKAAA